jgi:outer membrane protein assembly factor BamB
VDEAEHEGPEGADDPPGSDDASRRRPSIGRLPLAAGLLAAVLLAVTVVVAVTGRGGSSRHTDPRAEAWSMDAEDTALVEEALPGWEAVVEVDDVEPLALGAEPVWGQEHPSPWVLRDAWFRDDVAVLYGGYAEQPDDRLQVVDAGTGERRWGLNRGDEIPDGQGVKWAGGQRPAVVDLGDDTSALLVPYHCIDYCLEQRDAYATVAEESGVAALALDDGRLLWTSAVAANDVPETRQGPLESPVALVAGETAVVMAKEPHCSDTGRLHVGLQTVALDPVGGGRLWEVDGLMPVAVAGDTVLTEAEEASPEHPCSGSDQHDVVALDAATGEVRWDLRERFGRSDLVLTAGDLALVETAHETLVLDLTDGSEVASFGREVSDDCGSDGRTLIACKVAVPGRDGALATFDVESRHRGIALTNEAMSSIDSVGLDRVFADGTGVNGSVPSDEIGSFDRSAHLVDEDLPGALLAASPDYAMFVCSTSDCSEPSLYHGEEDEAAYPRYVVHRIDP